MEMNSKRVEFNEPKYRIPEQEIQQNLFINFLIEKGWVKNEQQVIYILFSLIGICILIIIWVFLNGNGYESIDPNNFIPAE